jgi:DNA invertase Pin-like site-specific DNA recombinase
MEKAMGYVRVSTQEQAKGVSLDAQAERIRAYCTLAGVELVGIIREEAVSGSKALALRPGGTELVRALAQGKATHVVALKLDRLFRDAADALEQTRAWDRKGIALHLCDVGGQAINTGSAMGRMFLTMMAGFAELERNLIAERTAQALAHLKANRQAYSRTPFGFDRKGSRLVGNAQELGTVARIRTLAQAGKSLRAIARLLNQEEVPTKRGGQWHARTVSYLLGNDLYAQGGIA